MKRVVSIACSMLSISVAFAQPDAIDQASRAAKSDPASIRAGMKHLAQSAGKQAVQDQARRDYVLTDALEVTWLGRRNTQAFTEGTFEVTFLAKECSQRFMKFVVGIREDANGKAHDRVAVVLHDSGVQCSGPTEKIKRRLSILGLPKEWDVRPFKRLKKGERMIGAEDSYLSTDIDLVGSELASPKSIRVTAAATLYPCAQQIWYLLIADGVYRRWGSESTSRTDFDDPNGSKEIRVAAMIHDSGKACAGNPQTVRASTIFGDNWAPDYNLAEKNIRPFKFAGN